MAIVACAELTSIRYCVQEVSVPIATFAPSHHPAPPCTAHAHPRVPCHTHRPATLTCSTRAFPQLEPLRHGIGEAGLCLTVVCCVCRYLTAANYDFSCAKTAAPTLPPLSHALTRTHRRPHAPGRRRPLQKFEAEAQHPHRDEPRCAPVRDHFPAYRLGSLPAPRLGLTFAATACRDHALWNCSERAIGLR